MIKTRAQLQTAINDVLQNSEPGSITPEQIRVLLIDISDSMFVSEDDYTYPTVVESLSVTSPTLGIYVDDIKILGGQKASINYNLSPTTLADLHAVVMAIISRLESHGLIGIPV